MNSKILKIALEGLGCVLIAIGLAHVPLAFQGFPLDLALLPLIWFALRQGVVPSIVCSFLFGCVYGIFRGDGNIIFILLEGIVAYTLVSCAGLFARNTVRTAFNHRLSSSVLNIATATILVHSFVFVVHGLATPFIGSNFYSSNIASFGEFVSAFWINALVNLGLQLALLMIALYVRKQLFIPKNTRFISRREQSHLLND